MKNKNISNKATIVKRGAAILLASTLVVMAMPAKAYATTTIDDLDTGEELETVNEDECMDLNKGTIGSNEGTVGTNEGTVGINEGEIVNNSGTVEINSQGANIYENTGEVTNNYGTTSSYDGGTVIHNYGDVDGLDGGIVTNNHEGASVRGTNGTIVNNVGGSVLTIDEGIINITNNYSGELTADAASTITITNNFSDNPIENPDSIVVENQFFSVTIPEVENADVTYSRPGFIHSDYNDKEYIKVKENNEPCEITGTITIAAKDGYKISDDGVLSGDTGQIVYTMAKNADGSYTVTLSSLRGSVTLTPEILHLIIEAFNQDNNTNVTTDGSVNVSGASDSSGSSAAVAGVVASPQIIVGGKIYKSTVSGAFITQNITIAVVAPASDLKTKAGLGAGESLNFKGWEFTAKQSPLAYQALTDVAGAIGGNVLQCVELNFGKMTFGKFSELDESVISRTTISLPKKAEKNKKHALARAAKGGKTQILENFSEDPNVITSDIPGGAAAYAIVEY